MARIEKNTSRLLCNRLKLPINCQDGQNQSKATRLHLSSCSLVIPFLSLCRYRSSRFSMKTCKELPGGYYGSWPGFSLVDLLIASPSSFESGKDAGSSTTQPIFFQSVVLKDALQRVVDLDRSLMTICQNIRRFLKVRV